MVSLLCYSICSTKILMLLYYNVLCSLPVSLSRSICDAQYICAVVVKISLINRFNDMAIKNDPLAVYCVHNMMN